MTDELQEQLNFLEGTNFAEMLNDDFIEMGSLHVNPVSSNNNVAHAFQSNEQGASLEMNSRFQKFSSDTEIEESIKMSVPNSTKTKDTVYGL